MVCLSPFWVKASLPVPYTASLILPFTLLGVSLPTCIDSTSDSCDYVVCQEFYYDCFHNLT